MTQKQKKRLSKISFLLLSLLAISHLISVILIFKKAFIFVVLVYALFLFLCFLIFNKNNKKINLLSIEKQDLLEKINLLGESVRKEKLLTLSLDKKNLRFSKLKQALDKFNQSLVLEDVGIMAAEEIFSLFGGIGNVIIYLVNQENNRLEVLSSKKINPQLIIKEKYGDLFDEWVLKHNQPLLVEDADKDFRFDSERIKKELSRTVGSVMIVALAVPNRFLGVLRIELETPQKFNSEDLRFLSTLSGLTSIALENSFLYQHTEELSIKDGLTGLYLRRFLNERGKEEMEFAKNQSYDLSILMVDIDYFKSYNDKFGHRYGDIVLVHIAKLLKGFFSNPERIGLSIPFKEGPNPKYIVSRFGGEEFAVLLPFVNKEGAIELAESLRKNIQDRVVFLRRSPVKITVSIGVASYPQDTNSWIDLIKRSDLAMYKAKQEGRNRVCFMRCA